jgi:hypothetical protein
LAFDLAYISKRIYTIFEVTMRAAEYNFDYDQGTTLSFLITYQDNLENPIDLTGYTFAGQIRRRITDADVLGNLVVTAEDAEAGQIRVTVLPETLVGVSFRGVESFRTLTPLVYDVEITSPSGDVTRLINGTIRVSPEVTR